MIEADSLEQALSLFAWYCTPEHRNAFVALKKFLRKIRHFDIWDWRT
jgi:hypothetical protein